MPQRPSSDRRPAALDAPVEHCATLFYVARENGELTKVLRVRVSEQMLSELVARAGLSGRSAGAVARAAIRSYLAKGKR